MKSLKIAIAVLVVIVGAQLVYIGHLLESFNEVEHPVAQVATLRVDQEIPDVDYEAIYSELYDNIETAKQLGYTVTKTGKMNDVYAEIIKGSIERAEEEIASVLRVQEGRGSISDKIGVEVRSRAH